MKILYRILVILLWIPVVVYVAIGLPICFSDFSIRFPFYRKD